MGCKLLGLVQKAAFPSAMNAVYLLVKRAKFHVSIFKEDLGSWFPVCAAGLGPAGRLALQAQEQTPGLVLGQRALSKAVLLEGRLPTSRGG